MCEKHNESTAKSEENKDVGKHIEAADIEAADKATNRQRRRSSVRESMREMVIEVFTNPSEVATSYAVRNETA